MFSWSNIPKTVQLAARLTFITVVTVLTVITVLPLSDVSFARPPAQEPGGEPVFQASSYAAADGSSTVRSQETTLGGAYFSSHGTVEGLEVIPDGLRLAAGATTGTYTSEPLTSPLAVTTDLVPSWRATLPPGAQVKLETRLSSDGVNWTEWAENPVAFYPVRDDEHAGSLVWIGSRGPVLAQMRLTLSAPGTAASPILHYLTLVFSDASQGPTDAAIAAQLPAEAAVKVCPAERPPIVSRTQWGSPDGQGSPRWLAERTEVTHVVIHHTATPSTFEEWNRRSPYYQISDWATVVRAIWNYHANTLRWGDIGYNYVIDPEGKIYEGRAGNQDGLYDIVGAHDGKNRNSMGVGFIGCYGNCDYLGLQNADPPHVMMNKGVELIAWKVGKRELDPHGQALYHGRLTPVIAGGRDVTATYSPGDKLYYNWLPWVRDAVRDRTQCPKPTCQVKEILFDQDFYNLNQPINLIARVTDDKGNPLGGAKVTATVSVQEFATADASSIILEDKTGEYHGTYPYTTKPGIYTFNVAAEHTNFQTCSLSRSVEVRPQDGQRPCTITARAEPSTLTPGAPVNLIASVTLDGQDVTNADVIAHITGPDSSFAEVTLPWQSGNAYRQAYQNTHAQGQYTFFATASGQGFEQCSSATSSFTVQPTAGTMVSVEPTSLQIPLCSPQEGMAVNVKSVTGLRAVSLEVRYDPRVVQVIDADAHQQGVQVRPDGAFLSHPSFIVQNEVDTANGRIHFSATLLGSETIEGDAGLIVIDWRPQNPGTTQVTLSSVTLVGADGQPIAHSPQNGSVEVTPGCGTHSGVATLQGRSNHSGITVTSASGAQTQTDAQGFFHIEGSEPIMASYAGYLSAVAEPGTAARHTAASSDTITGTTLGKVTLVAGDLNQDNVIDIFDLAYLAHRLRTHDSLSDLNADGEVNIVDLALMASNYGQRGPLTTWQ